MAAVVNSASRLDPPLEPQDPHPTTTPEGNSNLRVPHGQFPTAWALPTSQSIPTVTFTWSYDHPHGPVLTATLKKLLKNLKKTLAK
jgi:hypothetical protein